VIWLEQAGYEDIFLVDNDSTYTPLLEYYEQTPHTIIRLGLNVGHHGPWTDHEILNTLRQNYFVVTDPDVIPVAECPPDAVQYFFNILMRHPDRNKIGFSLKTDDLPDHYKFKREVIKWESQFQNGKTIEANVFAAPIDTTFALYRPLGSPHIDNAARTQFPYQARHMTWYVDSNNPTEEDRYYTEHARVANGTTWAMNELPSAVTNTMPK
jgi:hypothetical protein